MPTPPPVVPGALLGSETGLPDSTWINEVRDALKDYPRYVGEQFTGDGVNGGLLAAGTLPIMLVSKPIWDGVDPQGRPGISVAVQPPGGPPALPYPVTTTYPPAAGKVFVDYNTAELSFPSAPAATSITFIAYRSVKKTDQTILSALQAGLREMFPAFGKNHTDVTIPIRVNQWDYQLPPWAADPNSRILKVEIIETNVPTEPYRELRVWKRTGLDLLTIPQSQRWSPTANLRVTGWGPYLKLGDLEPQLYMLPVWYALGVLMGNAEAQDRRRDDQTAQVEEQAGAQLQQLQMARHYMNLFQAAITSKMKSAGPGFTRKILSTYERNAYPYSG